MRTMFIYLLSALIALTPNIAYSDAVIFSGSDVKTLKSNIDLFGQSKILSGTVDPTGTATSAPVGSIYLNASTGELFRKIDAGSSTNWIKLNLNANYKNYIINVGAEVDDTTGMTDASSIMTRNTTNPLFGRGDFAIDSSSSGQLVAWSVRSIDNFLEGNNCEASFVYSGDASLYKAYVRINSVNVSGDYTLQNFSTTQKGPVYITFPCGDGANQPELVIESTSASAAAINVDIVYLGAVTQIGQFSAISEWQNAGAMTIGATTTAPTKGTMTTDQVRWRRVGSNAEIEYTYYKTALGSAAAGSGDYLYSLPTGLQMSSDIPNFTTVTNLQLSADATRSVLPTSGTININGSSGDGAVLAYKYSSTQFRLNVAEYYASSGNISSTFFNLNTAAVYGMKFTITVPIQGWSASQSAAAANQTDYGWRSYTPASYQGIGTPTNVECQEMRQSENLFIACKLTTGTVSSNEMRVALPNSLTTSGTSKIPSIRKCGDGSGGSASGAGFFGNLQVLCEPNVSYLTFGVNSSTLNGTSKINGNVLSSTTSLQFTAGPIPISGWEPNQRAPTLIGSVTSNSTGAIRDEFASVADSCSSTPCTLVQNTGSFLSSISRGGTGTYTLNFTSGSFSVAPVCNVTPVNAGSNVFIRYTSAPTTTSGTVQVVNTAGTGVDAGLQIHCKGFR